MFCTRCGKEMAETNRFCPNCGQAKNAETIYEPGLPPPRLIRPAYQRKIAGVCAGFARYFDADVTLMRIIAIVLLFWPIPGLGAIAYLVAWFLMPREPLALPAPGMQTANDHAR